VNSPYEEGILNAKEFADKHGRDAVYKVCEKVGISLIYWSRIKNLHCTVSSARALELARASDEVTGDPMTVVDLLRMREVPSRVTGSGRGAE